MIDGTGKKILVVNEAINHLELTNATANHIRLEQLDTKYDYIIARAVSELSALLRMTHKYFKPKHINARPKWSHCLQRISIKIRG
jgi:16S rRNA (guanine527-N7)-methyltransferase